MAGSSRRPGRARTPPQCRPGARAGSRPRDAAAADPDRRGSAAARAATRGPADGRHRPPCRSSRGPGLHRARAYGCRATERTRFADSSPWVRPAGNPRPADAPTRSSGGTASDSSTADCASPGTTRANSRASSLAGTSRSQILAAAHLHRRGACSQRSREVSHRRRRAAASHCSPRSARCPPP